MLIRPALESDIPAISEVHLASQRAAYRSFFPHQFFEANTRENSRAIWRERLFAAPPLNLHLATDRGRVAGFVGFGTSPRFDDGNHAEIRVLHVHPDYWRRGVGTTLLGFAESRLAEAGFAEATLWVYTRNDRARRFYEAKGWLADGTAELVERGGQPVAQVRYGKRVVP